MSNLVNSGASFVPSSYEFRGKLIALFSARINAQEAKIAKLEAELSDLKAKEVLMQQRIDELENYEL